uniref:A-kinase anchor protein 8-like n=1 Tax=Dermatophagoides pteronyssinus TaxID=6956 RepID=A0A6P6XMW1_DERPT|nr:A-kinase anchor protein 8-like [Dermatophagoides pteronyssinus]
MSLFYKTKKFCCFIWSALDCETEVANKCNQNFSQSAKKNTIDCFRDGCNEFSYGSWSCWWTPNKINITLTTVIAILIALGIIVSCFLAFKPPRSAKIDQNLAKISSDNKIITKKMQLAQPGPEFFHRQYMNNTPKKLETIFVPADIDLSTLPGPSWRVFAHVPATPPTTPPPTPPPTVIAEAALPLLDGAIQSQII